LRTVFGGFAESLYAVGVAHADDRAESANYVALSSTLLFVWALGGAIGPTVSSLLMEVTRPNAFFIYACRYHRRGRFGFPHGIARAVPFRLQTAHEGHSCHAVSFPKAYLPIKPDMRNRYG